MKHPGKVLKTVRLSEKANTLSSNLGKYTVEVFVDADKPAIRSAIESVFKVKVTRINVITTKGKATRGRFGRPGFKSDTKKAIVTLKQGDKIELV